MTQTAPTDRPTLLDEPLDFGRFGHFTRPIVPADVAHLPEADAEDWLAVERDIGALRRGDFSVVAALLARARRTRQWPLRTVITRVLGEAGDVACFRDMRAELEAAPWRQAEALDPADRETALLYAQAFGAWGRLDVVPVLLDLYVTLQLKGTAEIAILPILIAQLLTAERGSLLSQTPPPDRLEDYFSLVLHAHEQAVARLGSDQAIVFRGEPVSVTALARAMRGLEGRFPATELRRLRERFEPATGIDCSAIFAGGVSPLDAAALAEDFLDSADAARFEPGVRYFFGHRVPD